MEKKFDSETHRKVHDNTLGTLIKIGPDSDGLGLVEIDGGDEYGRMVMEPELALLVADAIRKTAEEMMHGVA
jgi:hypothetical protein